MTVESWIKEGDQDKSKLYGFDLPNGTWFVKMKITNDDLWQKIKAGELKGLSIEGYFTNKFEQMQKKEPTDAEILSALNEIIKEKTELKSKKVELGLMDDLEKLHKEGSKLSSEANGAGLSAVRKAIQKADKDFTQLSRKSEEGIDKAEKFIKAAKELGVDAKQVQGYLNNFKSWSDDADYWIKQLNADQYN